MDAILLNKQIENAYIENLSIVNSTIEQINYDSDNNIISSGNATYTEYRYTGQNPDNYIWFNCDDTENRHVDSSWYSSHCEKWRIIGVMDTNTTGENEPLVKIIRDSIGSMSWDYKQSGVGSSTSGYGSNDWSDSQLMMMLNKEEYLNQGYRVNSNELTNTVDIHGRTYAVDKTTGKVYYGETTQSVMQMTYNENTGEWAGAYYNKTAGCRPASTGASGYTCNSVDFSSNGLRDEAKDYIQPVIWHLGGHDTNGVTTGAMYQYERGTSVVNTNRPTTWYGEIGLMYPTDWAMATDLGKIATGTTLCKDTNLSGWNSYEACYNNWLYTNSWTWTITPFSNNVSRAFHIGSFLYNNYDVYRAYAVHPVLYLKVNTLVIGGTGTSDNPYQLML